MSNLLSLSSVAKNLDVVDGFVPVCFYVGAFEHQPNIDNIIRLYFV